MYIRRSNISVPAGSGRYTTDVSMIEAFILSRVMIQHICSYMWMIY